MFTFTKTTNPSQGFGLAHSTVKTSLLLKRTFYKVLLVSVAVLFAYSANATVYYVSASGSDANPGTSTSLPWKTLTKVNSFTPKPGDQILFNKGDEWTGTIIVKASGSSSSPIIYGEYGSGANPVISGFTTVTGWTNEGKGIYSKPLAVESNPEIVTINGVQYAMGRTPNVTDNQPTINSYYHIDSFSGVTSVTDSEVPAAVTNWTGAEMVVKNIEFGVWQRRAITGHTGTTLTLENKDTGVKNAVGFGYFIQKDLRTLDQYGEWFYGGGKFYMYFGGVDPSTKAVKVSTVNSLVSISSKNYISIKNIHFEGANTDAVYVNTSYGTKVDNCSFDFNNTGVRGSRAYELRVANNTFTHSTHQAIYQHWYSDGSYIGYNTVDSTGLVIGAGTSDWYTGKAMTVTYSRHDYSSKNTIVEYNRITNSGYTGIHFGGDSMIIRYNYINNYGLNKADNGGIQTGGNEFVNQTIDHNIVLNGNVNDERHGLPAGTVSNRQYNIYLDYYSTGGFTITNNTAAHCQGAGIMLHGSQNVVIRNNAVYDCAIGVRLQELDGLGYPSRNVTMDNNIVFAKTLSQLCLLVRSTKNDFNQYGAFTNNYYAKPIDNTNTFSTLVNTWANTYRNLSGWQSYASLDASSRMSTQAITNINELQFEYNTTVSPKTVFLSQPMTDAKGTKYGKSITLQPFSSAVLMKDSNPVLSDLTKPVTTVFTVPANSSSLVVPVTKFTVVGNQTVTGYKLTESATPPLANDAGWTATVPASYTFTSLGTKTLYAWAKDASGNVSAGVSAQVEIQKNIGYTEIYATKVANANRLAMPVTFNETGEINSISIYHEGGTDNLILGVYSDQGSSPALKLGVTASTAINSKPGWQTVSLTSPVLVNSGQTVWLAWVFEKNPGVRYTSGTPGRAASTSYWPPELPETFGASIKADQKYSIYCNYLSTKDLYDVTKPTVTAFTIPANSSSLEVPVNSFSATDNKFVTGYKITESAKAPNAQDAGWSAGAPTSYSFTSEGSKTLYAWVKDEAGNVSTSISRQVVISLSVIKKPVVNAFSIPSTSSSLVVAINSFTVSDNKAVTGFKITESDNAPNAGDTGWLASAPVSYHFASEGTKTIYAWAKDAAGNVSASVSRQVVIALPDVTTPSVIAFTIPTTSSSLVVPISSFAASDNKSVAGFKLTESAKAPNAGDAGWLASAPVSYPFASEGAKTLYAWAKDAAGNVSVSMSAQVVVALSSNNKNALGFAEVYNNIIKWGNQLATPVTFNEAGEINSISIYHEGGTGNIILGVYSDKSGSPSSRLGITASTVINSKPGWQTVSLTSPVAAVSGQIVWLSWVFQNSPGIRYTSGSPGRVASSNTWTTGMQANFGTSTFANTKYSVYCSYSPIDEKIAIDTKPTVTAFTTPANSSSLVVPVSSFIASGNKAVTGYMITESSTTPDTGNTGWTINAPTSYSFPTEGTKTLYAWAKDETGNVSASVSGQVVIALPDVTKPSVTIFTIPATSSSLVVPVSSFIASDNKAVTGYKITESATAPHTVDAGWNTDAPTSYTFATEGSKTLYAWAKDAAGNVSESVNGQMVITLPDAAKPTITAFTIPATSTSLVVSVSSFTASDNKAVTGFKLTESATAPNVGDAGWLASAPVSYSFASEGTKTIYAWAKDAAGNVSASMSAQVVVALPSNNKNALGFAEVYSNIIKWGNQLATPVTFNEAGEINSISIYHEGGTGNIILGVYADKSGSPSSRLGITASTVINSKPGWQTVSLTSPVAAISGQTVWLSWVFQNSPGIRYTSGSPGRVASSNTWATGMQANFGTSTFANTKYSVYCSYTSINEKIALDTKPTVTAFTIPATSSSLVVPVSSFIASDNKAVTGYMITDSSVTPHAGNTGWTINAPTSYSFTTEGTKTLYAWAKDETGNISASVSGQVEIALPDVTKPVITAFNIPDTTESLTIPIITFEVQDTKAVNGYLLTETSDSPAADNTGWSRTAPDTYTFSDDDFVLARNSFTSAIENGELKSGTLPLNTFSGTATKTLYAWTKDATGNISEFVSDQVLLNFPDDNRIDESETSIKQLIELKRGWNIFSTFLVPVNQSMDSVTETICVNGKLIKVQDEGYNTLEKCNDTNQWINKIGCLKVPQAYKIRVDSDCTLEITGTPIKLPLNIEIKTGWNLISFPINGAVNAMEVIQPLIDAGVLTKVQDEKGNSIEKWFNTGWRNGIGNFIAGEGYIVQACQDGVLTIDEKTSKKSGLSFAERLATTHFMVSSDGNGFEHMNINIIELNKTNLQIGDEIAAFDGNICVGAVKLSEMDFYNNAVSMPASASELNGTDGFTDRNSIELKVWKNEINEEGKLLSEATEGEMIFNRKTSVFVTVDDNQVINSNANFDFLNISVYPNPASNVVNVSFSILPESGTKITLMDMNGKEITSRLVENSNESIDIQHLPAGMYLVKTWLNNYTRVHKLIKQ
jgi:parallel beta-helix repeat protein